MHWESVWRSQEKALLHQFEQWIGGGHWFWHPRCAVLAERGGREGGQEKAPLRQFDQWIGGEHWFWLPRGALLASKGGREGPRERRRPRRH